MTDHTTPKSDMPDPRDPAFLDGYFQAAKAAPLTPSDDFMARLQQDALAQQARHSAAQRSPKGALRRDQSTPVAALLHAGLQRVAQWFAPMGGAPGVAGLASVALAGVWLGFVAPAPVSAFETWVIGTEADFIDAELALLAEIDVFLSGDVADDN